MVNIQKIEILMFIFTIFCTGMLIAGFSYAARLRSIFHCEHYDHVKDKIRNPRIEDHIFPDTLVWSEGGEEKHGLRLCLAIRFED